MFVEIPVVLPLLAAVVAAAVVAQARAAVVLALAAVSGAVVVAGPAAGDSLERECHSCMQMQTTYTGKKHCQALLHDSGTICRLPCELQNASVLLRSN